MPKRDEQQPPVTDERRDAAEQPDAAHTEADAKPQAAEELESLRRERDELNDRVLRLLADYQNLGRRAEQNVAIAREQQALEMARGLVGVLDNFDRALEVDPEKVTSESLLKGVSMVRDEMLRVLGRFGVERLDVEAGDAFDPNRHEAMMRQKADDFPGVESGQVTQQFQPGYLLKDKTIRPAQVGVAE